MTWQHLTAAQQDDLLRRPFDHFARYRLAAEVIEATVGPRARILDLGGGPGSLQAFLPEADVVASDVVVPGVWHETAPRLIVADGAAMPFADDAFDMVVSMDTLEHVPPGSRDPFLHEVARVAARWAFVVCPFGTPGVADADTALRAYVANRFAPDLPTIAILDEHLGYGHPDLAASTELLAGHGPVGVIPSGRIDRWFAGMVTFFHLLALGDDEPVEVTQRFLNRTFYEADLTGPSYRHGVLLRTAAAATDDRDPVSVLAPLQHRATQHQHAGGDLDLLRTVLTEALVASTTQARAELAGVRGEMADLQQRLTMTDQAERQTRAHAEGLQAINHDQANRIEVLEDEVHQLRAFRDQVRAHPAARLRRLLHRALKR